MSTRRAFLKGLAGTGAVLFFWGGGELLKTVTSTPQKASAKLITKEKALAFDYTAFGSPRQNDPYLDLEHSGKNAPHLDGSEEAHAEVHNASSKSSAEASLQGILQNSPSYLTTPTYDGSGQSVHPSVIDFKTEYGLENWLGYRYWMAFTPYPKFNSAYENPSLLVSHDGLTWFNLPGLKNPLAPRPPFSLLNNYNSDPELVFNIEQNQLFLYWREYKQDTYEKIWLKIFDGKLTESPKILCVDKPWSHKDGLILSPTIWRKSPQEWYMWTSTGDYEMNLRTSQDGLTWGDPQPCEGPWVSWQGGFVPWHAVARPNLQKKRIDFLISGWFRHTTIFDSVLVYATAPMNQPGNISMPLEQPVIGRGTGKKWDNGYIYRSSFIIEPGTSPANYRVWYSACTREKIWHIGYTEGKINNS